MRYTVEEAKDGALTLAVIDEGGRRYLHSRVSPLRESGLLSDSFDSARYDFLIVLGTGLGYHLIPLDGSRYAYRRIILIDVIEGIEPAVAGNPHTGFLTDKAGVRFISGHSPEEIETLLADEIDFDSIRGIQVLEHPASVRIFPEYYAEVKRAIERTIARKAGQGATKKALGLRYLQNAIDNISGMEPARPVSALFGAFQGKPGLVVTSGPSLGQCAGEIRQASGRVVIVCVDSALGALESRGIVPDIVVSIDPQPYVHEHLYHRSRRGGAVRAVSITANPSAFGAEKTFVSLSTHPVAQLADELFPGVVGSVDSRTGNVAGDAVRMALAMGCAPIGLVGFDFSFPRYEIYARGTSYQDRYALYFHDRMNTVETQNLRYIMKSSRAVRQDGRYTRRSFSNYKQELESMLAGEKRGDIHNLSAAGATIKGVRALSCREFIERYCAAMIDNKLIFRKALDRAPVLGRTLDFGLLRQTLAEPAVFGKIVNASLEVPLRPRKHERLIRLAMGRE